MRALFFFSFKKGDAYKLFSIRHKYREIITEVRNDFYYVH
jgi:hypothetical protein